MPIKFMCVNVHIFQNSSGTKNFNRSAIPGLRQVFDWINDNYWNRQVPSIIPVCTSRPTLAQQVDPRIRFILNRIEFYRDDTLATQAAAQGYGLLLMPYCKEMLVWIISSTYF